MTHLLVSHNKGTYNGHDKNKYLINKENKAKKRTKKSDFFTGYNIIACVYTN